MAAAEVMYDEPDWFEIDLAVDSDCAIEPLPEEVVYVSVVSASVDDCVAEGGETSDW